MAAARNFSFGDLPPRVLGQTDRFGNITIQRGLTGQVFDETLRHETVHSIISRALDSLSGAKLLPFITAPHLRQSKTGVIWVGVISPASRKIRHNSSRDG